MMRRYLPFLCCILLLAGLAGCGAKTQTETPASVLALPGTFWGMTPEDLTTALSLAEDTSVEERPQAGSGEYWTIRECYQEVFGREACLAFQFSDENGDGTYGLFRVTLTYPQDADMAAVASAMEKEFGAPDETSGTARKSWNSRLLCRDIMSEEDAAYFRENSAAGGEEALNAPVVQLRLYTDWQFGGEFRGAQSTNVVFLESAYSYYTQEGGHTGT